MRAEMAPPSFARALGEGGSAVTPAWQQGAGLLQTRITRVMGRSVPSVHRAEPSRAEQ